MLRYVSECSSLAHAHVRARLSVCEDGLTSTLGLDSTLQNVTHGKQAKLVPELRRNVLADLEIPRTTARVSWVFPDWLDAHVEEVNRVSQLQALDRNVVEVLIKLFDANNLLAEWLWPRCVLF